MADTGMRRWQNAPKQGQRGFRRTHDQFELTGKAPPRHLQCELEGCYDLAVQDPRFRSYYPIKMCQYHLRLCDRMGAPYPCDLPWEDFYRIRDNVRKQLNKVQSTPVVTCAVQAVEKLPSKCYARAAELEDRGKEPPVHIRYGLSLRHRVEPRRFIDHHVTFNILMERGLWKPQPGYPRHPDKAWLRCVHRALSWGKKAERAEIGPYQASLLRKMIAPDLQVISGRTDYALRQAEQEGKDVLARRKALGWFQDSLT